MKNKAFAGEFAIIKSYTNPYKLNEISQTKSLRFNLLAPKPDSPKELEAFHPAIKCRDYFSDVLHYKQFNQSISIYGFNLEPSQNKLDMKKTRLLIHFPEGDSIKLFIDQFELLLEEEHNWFDLPPIQLYAVKGNKNSLILIADKFYQSMTQLMSLLTLWCRFSAYPHKADEKLMEGITTGVDANYITKLRESDYEKKVCLLPKINMGKMPSLSGFNPTAYIGNVHNFGGILSLCQYTAPKGSGKDIYISDHNYIWEEINKQVA